MTPPNTPRKDEVREIAANLTKAQRACIMNGSWQPKGWGAIRRHAKIHPHHHRVFGLARFFDHGANWRAGYFLTPLGLEIRAKLKESGNAD